MYPPVPNYFQFVKALAFQRGAMLWGRRRLLASGLPRVGGGKIDNRWAERSG